MPEPSPDQPAPEVTRRVVLRGAALGGVAVPLLVACGSDGGDAEAPATSAGASDPTTEGGSPPAEPSDSEAPSGLVSTAEVPVGGGMILPDEQIVVTQPTEGAFKAFTAVCTHQACVVSSVSDGTINCGCHGSMYSVEDGSVTGGPAPAPLDEIAISVEGDQITRS